MIVLGVTSTISWNSSACLLVNGELKSFVEEERFNEIKHSVGFPPKESIRYCLEESKIGFSEIDVLAVGWMHPLKHTLRSVSSCLADKRVGELPMVVLDCIEHRISLERWVRALSREYGVSRQSIWNKIKFFPHHLSHAASACMCSGFEESNFLVYDGRGEYMSGCVGHYHRGQFTIHKTVPIGSSIGALYSEITSLIGFRSHSHEGKTMGLAAYGQVDFDLLKGACEITPDGYYFRKNWKATLRSRFKTRKRNEPIEDIHRDLAATVQRFQEIALMNVAKDLNTWRQSDFLCLAGGSFLNCDTNSLLIEKYAPGGYFIQPAANDAGVSLGAALMASKAAKSHEKTVFFTPYLGPSFSADAIRKILDGSGLEYEAFSIQAVVDLLARGKIVGRFDGRMEVGPRALGNRSILASPAGYEMRDKINRQVKHREEWRPFAPIVLSDYATKVFENYRSSPYMLQTFTVKSEWRERIRAAVHEDNTARVQEVSETSNAELHKILSGFYERTGIPALVNTSFNDSEKPIVQSPKQAVQTFYSTGIDALVVGPFLLRKSR